ncbi:transporter [Asanoa siamensis]|uniref:Transporter n=1 Tax=Asanoa siamensis TaxID=926357 RepID=A0ABQ4CVN0_9ACTN|nr:transporter [Asanoa siamensis]
MIWGSSFLFIKVGVAELHPLYVTLGRVLAGVLTLLAVLLVTRDRLPRDPRLWLHLSVTGVIGTAMPFTLFGYGEERVSSSLAGIWNATTALLVLPLAVYLFRTERMTARRAAGLLIGFVGVLVVLGVWEGLGGAQFTGQLMCIAAAACYAVAIPYTKRFISDRRESGISLAAGQLVTATIALAIVAPLAVGAPTPLTDLSFKAIASILALGAIGTGLAFVLNMRNIKLVGATTASMVTYLIPVFAVILGVLALDEHVTWHQPVGALVVLVGVAVAQGLFTRRKPAKPAPSVPESELAPDPA